jgi:hypothetical protein
MKLSTSSALSRNDRALALLRKNRAKARREGCLRKLSIDQRVTEIDANDIPRLSLKASKMLESLRNIGASRLDALRTSGDPFHGQNAVIDKASVKTSARTSILMGNCGKKFDV